MKKRSALWRTHLLRVMVLLVLELQVPRKHRLWTMQLLSSFQYRLQKDNYQSTSQCHSYRPLSSSLNRTCRCQTNPPLTNLNSSTTLESPAMPSRSSPACWPSATLTWRLASTRTRSSHRRWRVSIRRRKARWRRSSTLSIQHWMPRRRCPCLMQSRSWQRWRRRTMMR